MVAWARARGVEGRQVTLTRTKDREEGAVETEFRWMRRSSKQVFVLCLCLISLWAALGQGALASQASTPLQPDVPGADLQIQQLRIQVMPEFDDPRVLIIVQGRLADSSTSFPASITFRVPAGAQINQMASIGVTSGSISSRPYELQADPADARWSLVTYSLDSAHFFYEYYLQAPEGETEKQVEFTFSSLQAVKDLVLEVQQPRAATHFVLDALRPTPRFDKTVGLTYHQVKIGVLPAGGESVIRASYTKTDPAPSVSRQQLAAMQGENGAEALSRAAVATRQKASAPSLWLLFVLACVAMAGLIFFIWFRAYQNSTTVALVPQAGSGPFCRRCGAELRRNAQFCHFCGTGSVVVLEP
jgi:hypothetical protein